jgi:hypothetical protein
MFVFTAYISKMNKELYESVDCLSLQKVTYLLQNGANPNYVRQAQIWDNKKSKWCDWYNSDGSEKPDDESYQPTTPLKLCVFKFSDCMSSESDQRMLIQIAKVLIEQGADKNSALDYFISRYGDVEKDDPNDVWCIFYKLLTLPSPQPQPHPQPPSSRACWSAASAYFMKQRLAGWSAPTIDHAFDPPRADPYHTCSK